MANPPTLDEAFAHCEARARAHYENFPVGLFVPRAKRPYVHALYAFARAADDFADEPIYAGHRTEKLDEWEERLHGAYRGQAEDPIFVALAETVRRLEIPQQLLLDLLSAFKQDTVKQRYETWDELLDYCRRSADPVGRLVLIVFGQRDPALAPLSDAICTALQLANHWQDLAIDWRNDRLYVPRELLQRFGVTEADLSAEKVTDSFGALMAELVARTRALFASGRPLCDRVGRELRFELRLTWLGGSSILDRIQAVHYDIFRRRPKHRLPAKLGIGVAGVEVARGARMSAPSLAERLTRQSGSSFYYAFRLLPDDKRRAIYALYSFCRVVDDCVDEPDGEGEAGLARWWDEFQRCYQGAPRTELGRELAEAVNTFPIPRACFEDIVHGCRMDLTTSRYETYDDLLVYSRRVASAVGLASIEIFGYREPRTRDYAIELGLALQLTNILRDVGQDAQRDRLYLPLADLARFDVDPKELMAAALGQAARPARTTELMAFEGERARAHFARAAAALASGERRAMLSAEVMGAVYRDLLEFLARRNYPLSVARLRLSTARRVWIVLRTVARVYANAPDAT